MFADPAYDIAPQAYQHLQLSDPRLKNQYRDELHQQLQYHKVYDKVQALQEISDAGTWSATDTAQYQQLDKIITEAMLHAERNTGKRVSTRYEWSPELKQPFRRFAIGSSDIGRFAIWEFLCLDYPHFN